MKRQSENKCLPFNRTPAFRDWAFMQQRGEPIQVMWDKIPSEVDILVTHGPPLGKGHTRVLYEREVWDKCS